MKRFIILLCMSIFILGATQYETFGRTTYEAKVTYVKDGDTFVAEVKLWQGLVKTMTIRVHDYDAPEEKPRKKFNVTEAGRQAERDFAELATEYAVNLLWGQPIFIVPTGKQSFGREVCDVFVIHEHGLMKNFVDLMKEAGYLKKKEWDIRIK